MIVIDHCVIIDNTWFRKAVYTVLFILWYILYLCNPYINFVTEVFSPRASRSTCRSLKVAVLVVIVLALVLVVLERRHYARHSIQIYTARF